MKIERLDPLFLAMLEVDQENRDSNSFATVEGTTDDPPSLHPAG